MNGISVSFANPLRCSVFISSIVLAVWFVGGVESPLGSGAGSTGSAVPFAAVPCARTSLLQAASSLLSQGQSCPHDGCSLPGWGWRRGCTPASIRRLPSCLNAASAGGDTLLTSSPGAGA